MKRPIHILAVDDQPAILLLIRKVLEPAGFEVSEARSGAEALAAAHESAPDLILLDMHLADMHGLDVLHRLREAPWGTRLRVVAMSALPGPEDHAGWLQAGFLGMIEKPIDVNTFVQEIHQWLQKALPGKTESPDGEVRVEHTPKDRLGEILLANLLITPEQLQAAIEAQATTGKRLGQVLVEQGALSEDDLAWALSNQLGYPYIFLRPEIIDLDAVRLLPSAFLQERRILPILKFGQEMTLAMGDPTDQRTVDEVAERTGLQVKRALALASNIAKMQERFLAHRDAAASTERAAIEAQYLQFHLVQALRQGASEIHFDPSGDGQARVRYRLEGVLVDRPAQPADLHAAILAHLRELTGAVENRVGAASADLTVGGADILLLAAFLPTVDGQAATVTLLPRHTDAPDVASLGVSDDVVRPLREALTASRGVVVVGCGDRWLRSTLLHALLPTNTRGKTWTLETLPVYRRPTLTQTALESPAAAALHLRGAVNAGADLIMVDDVSHDEAQQAACEAGWTRVVLVGHPHGDVVGILSDLLNGAGTALVASTLRGILVARPLRLLCPACRQSAATPGESAGSRAFVPVGCEVCGFTGFRGRRALVEVWVADAETRALLRSGSATVVFESIERLGSRMRAEGLALVEAGLTSLDELTRVMEGDAWTLQTSSS